MGRFVPPHTHARTHTGRAGNSGCISGVGAGFRPESPGRAPLALSLACKRALPADPTLTLTRAEPDRIDVSKLAPEWDGVYVHTRAPSADGAAYVRDATHCIVPIGAAVGGRRKWAFAAAPADASRPAWTSSTEAESPHAVADWLSAQTAVVALPAGAEAMSTDALAAPWAAVLRQLRGSFGEAVVGFEYSWGGRVRDERRARRGARRRRRAKSPARARARTQVWRVDTAQALSVCIGSMKIAAAETAAARGTATPFSATVLAQHPRARDACARACAPRK